MKMMKTTLFAALAFSLLVPVALRAQDEEEPVKFESVSRYDFVPGDQVLYYEDFSQDNIGDFPALWASNGSGEVKTVSIAQGKWFHLNGESAVYCYTKTIDFPANFIMEFDLIPDAEYLNGIVLNLYQESEYRELNDDLYPGEKGLQVMIGPESWETKGYTSEYDDWLEGSGTKAPVVKETVNHVIIWVQNRRVRIYHQGQKVIDMSTNIQAGTRFNRLLFSGWDRASYPYISNIQITTASPDTRSKLITDGKLVTYGIYFDSGKDVVKPESYGTIQAIASVLKENPGVRIKIVGHTDSDGDDALNMDLSKRRAAAVKAYLVKEFQVDAAGIETDGKGESQPVMENTSPENKAKNRRVEFLKL